MYVLGMVPVECTIVVESLEIVTSLLVNEKVNKTGTFNG